VASSFAQYDRLILVEPSGLGLSASTSQLAGSFLLRGAMLSVWSVSDDQERAKSSSVWPEQSGVGRGDGVEGGDEGGE